MAKTDSIDKLKCKIAILEDAKKRLLNKSDTFICVAIYSVTEYKKNIFRSNSHEYEAASAGLRNYISKSISPYGYFNSWVIHQPRRKVRMTKNDFREARIQWIDWMIKCLNEDMIEKTGE